METPKGETTEKKLGLTLEDLSDNWIEAMIDRESIPKSIRQKDIKLDDFVAKYGISHATYYYQVSKTENQKRIIEKSLRFANSSTPKILEVLRDKAKNGDTKAIEMHLEYVTKLSKKIDVMSGGKELKRLTDERKQEVDELIDSNKL